MKPITGSCLCKEVAFELSQPAVIFLYCHCKSCQKSTGSLHAANLAFPDGSLSWVRGDDLIQRFVDESDNPGFTRCFCSHCGSFLPKHSRNGQFWVVPSGLLDVDPGIRPSGSIYWAEHAEWLALIDDIPKYDEGYSKKD